MKTRVLIIALTLTLGFVTACTDTKKTEEKKVEEKVEVKTETNTQIDEDAKRKQDSIRQVKEHGHAH